MQPPKLTAAQFLDEQIIELAAAGRGRPKISKITGAPDWEVRGRLKDPAIREAIADRQLELRRETSALNISFKNHTLELVYAAVLAATTMKDRLAAAKIILHAPDIRMPQSSSNNRAPDRIPSPLDASLEELEAATPAPPPPAENRLEELENLEAPAKTIPAPAEKTLENLEELEGNTPNQATPAEENRLENLEAPAKTIPAPAEKALENLEELEGNTPNQATPAGDNRLEDLEANGTASGVGGQSRTARYRKNNPKLAAYLEKRNRISAGKPAPALAT